MTNECILCGEKLVRNQSKYCHDCGIKVQKERLRNLSIEQEIKRKKLAEQWNKLTPEQQQNIMMNYCKEVLENE